MDDNMDGDHELTLSAYLETPKFVEASTNATRLINKLKNAVQSKQLYETQQILSTVYYRFINSKEKIEPLIDLLYYGAVYLLQQGEHTSGQEIASLFLQTSAKRLQDRLDESGSSEAVKQVLLRWSYAYHDEKRTLDLDICQKVSNIAIQLPDTELGQAKFIAESLKLLPPKILNRDLLHNTIALRYWRFKDCVNARYHFLHCANSDNAQDVASLLVEFHSQKGNRSEMDLFITQFILQFLCLQHPIDSPSSFDQASRQQRSTIGPSNSVVSRKSRNTIKLIAEKIFVSYLQGHPLFSQAEMCPPFQSLPLLNFTYFIISILDSNKPEANAYKTLLDTYQPVWSRDPNYQSYLNRIGVLFFGLVDRAKQQHQQQGGGGFFNNIIMSLMDGTDDEDDDTTPEPSREAGSPFITSCDEVD